MFTSVNNRSFFVLSGVLVIVTLMPILIAGIFFPGALTGEVFISAVLSVLNSVTAAYFAVLGSEGTFKRLINGFFFRILLLVILMLLLILYGLADPLRLFISFLVFYLLHQSVLMIWLKRQVKQQMNQSSGDIKT